MRTAMSGHGITVGLPEAWEGRISLREATPIMVPDVSTGPDRTYVVPEVPDSSRKRVALSSFREQTRPLVHLASFALPGDRGDFGSGAVDVMGPDDILISLVEYGPECVGTALFANDGLPQPLPGQFDPNTLQRRIRGQYGYQRFVTVNQRPFCVYIVIGSAHGLGHRTTQARDVLAHTRIEAR